VIKPFPLEAGHPANFGYVKCANCGVQRPAARLNAMGLCGAGCEPTKTPSHFDPPKPPTEALP